MVITSSALAATYTSPMPYFITEFDPQKTVDAYSLFVVNQMCDRLFQTDTNGQIIYQIANKVNISNDGLIYTIQLKNDVFFHNGQKLTADDVIFSLQRLMEKESVKYDVFSYVMGVEEFHANKSPHVSGLHKINDLKLQITLNSPFPPFLSILSSFSTEIYPKDLLNRSANHFFKMPICIGPFKIAKNNSSEILLQRDDRYYGKKSKINALRIVFMDKKKSLQCLKANQCHDLRWYHYDENIDHDDYIIDQFPVTHINLIAFNLNHYPFTNLHVRKAFSYAFNRQKLLKECYADKIPALGYIMRGIGGYDLSAKELPYNIKKAKEELSKVVLDPAQLKKEYIFTRMQGSLCQNLFSKLVKDASNIIGLNIKVRHINPATFFKEYFTDKSYDMANFSMISDYEEAYFLLKHFKSKDPENFTKFSNDEVDQVLNKVLKINNRYERYQMYMNAQNLILKKYPVINLYQDIWKTYYQKNVHGYSQTRLGINSVSLRNVYFSK